MIVNRKRPIRYVTVACLWTAFCTHAPLVLAQPPNLSAAQRELVAVNKARMDAAAKRDLVVWSRYVADDCVFSDDDGVVQTKQQMLKLYQRLPARYDRAVDPREYIVRIHGNLAVINYRATVHEQYGDTDIISEQRRTETHSRNNGAWRLAAIQWSNIPVNFRKPVAVDTSVYQDYVGQYEWRPGDKVETITAKGGKLWSQIGDEAPDEYLPAGGETFFFKEGDLASFKFVRDAQSRVVGYTYLRIDGQEVHAKKIH